MSILVDEDIEKLSLPELRQLFMRCRKQAEEALNSLEANGNDHCWDGAIDTVLTLVPTEKRRKFKLGKFGMPPGLTLRYCAKYIAYRECQPTNHSIAEDKTTTLD